MVHIQAKKGFGWASAVGVPMDYDDAFQEASLAFLTAQEGFDPEAGYKFSAYYTMAAFSQFRKAIGVLSGVKNLNSVQKTAVQAIKDENEQRKAQGLAPLTEQFYGLNAMHFSALDMEDGEAFEQNLQSGFETPEEILMAKQSWQECENRLSPLARLMVEWLCEPPPALLRELEAQGAHSDYRVELGEHSQSRHPEVSLASIGRFLRLSDDVKRGDVMLAEAEIEKVCAELETGAI